MTIRKGDDWGRIGPEPCGVVTVYSNAEVRAIVERSRFDDSTIPPLMLLGGDLRRMSGGSVAATQGSRDVAIFPIDLVRVEAGERTGWFASHLVARRSWWRGEIIAVVNSQFIGEWDVAPRGHPNDGRVEVVRVAASMSIRDRVRARRRLHLGTHVPHPSIATRSTSATTISFARPLRLWLDGETWGRADCITLTVEPDALTVCM